MFARLSDRDFDGVAAMLHENVEFELAYAPEGLDMPVRGRAGVHQLLTSVIGAMFEPFRIEVTAVHHADDGATLVAEYRGDAVVRHNGRPYRNRYVGIFTIDGDAISSWREYHDPEVATRALAP
jgi:ketosteroid isomerase-like protein